MSEETATLIAAMVAAGFSVTTTLLTAWRQSSLERWKWQKGLADQAALARRTAIADLGRQLALGYHVIGWFTWKAEKAPSSLTPDHVAAYDAEMKTLLPVIVGAHLLVTAMDRSTGERIAPLVKKLYDLDVEVAVAGIGLTENNDESLAKLRGFLAEANKRGEKLHAEIADIMYPPSEREPWWRFLRRRTISPQTADGKDTIAPAPSKAVEKPATVPP